MPERDRITFDEADMAARDVQDVLFVVGLVLNADPEPLQPSSRDALATVIRLGQRRAEVVHMGMDDLRKGLR